MKKIYLLIISSIFTFQIQAQYLSVPQVIQEQNEWCWAAVSKAVLDYYGVNKSQCQIADYARTVITWRDFGSENCCSNPSGPCNYWNYNWGNNGSIQDILRHFASIENHGVGSALSLSDVNTEIGSGRPFVIRWGWKSGGGHFVIGHGISGTNLSYMDPWFGEGHHTSTYTWVRTSSNHDWTHTNVITTNLDLDEYQLPEEEKITLYPNPANTEITIQSMESIQSIRIYNTLGSNIKTIENIQSNQIIIPVIDFANGMYMVEIATENDLSTIKFIKQ